MITDADIDPIAIPAIRRLLRNIPDLGDYGIVPGVHYGASDWDAVEQGLVNDHSKQVFIPSGGNYYWDEQITLKHGIALEGVHKSVSVFSCFHNNDLFRATGQFGTGGALRNMSIVKAYSGNCVSFVRLLADASGYSPDFFEIDGCNFTGTAGGTASYPILLDGNARTGFQSNALCGLRDIRVRDTDVFNGTSMSIEVRNCRGLTMDSVKIFQGNGSCQNARISGLADLTQNGGTNSRRSTNVAIAGCSINKFIVDWANIVIAYGSNLQDVTFTANAQNASADRVFGVSSVDPAAYNCRIDR